MHDLILISAFLIMVWFGLICVMLYARAGVKGTLFLFAAMATAMARVWVSNSLPTGESILDLMAIGLFTVGAFLLVAIESKRFSSTLKSSHLRDIAVGRFYPPVLTSEEINLAIPSWGGIIFTLFIFSVLIVSGVTSLLDQQEKFEAYTIITVGVAGVTYCLVLAVNKLRRKRQ